jgi:hypothetical protein
VLLLGESAAGLALWIIGVLFWLDLTYVMLPGLMEAETKPKLTEGLNGAWLLVVVGTQAVSVLASLLVPALAADAPDGPLFVAPLLGPIAVVFVWVSLAAWTLAFVGLARYVITQGAVRPSRRAARAATASPAASTGERST